MGFSGVFIDSCLSRQISLINPIPPNFYNVKQGKKNIWVGRDPPNILFALFQVIKNRST